MRTQVPLKTKTILALLAAVAVMDALSLFLFTRIDFIVHSDLYRYGLQFSHAWADPYWFSSHAFVGSIAITVILIGVSMVSLLIHVRKHGTLSKNACYALLTIGTALAFLSIYLFYSIDSIVNNELYFYGLQFSINWAADYWTYARSMLALIGLGSAITVTSMALIFLGTRRLVITRPARLIFQTLGAIAAGAAALALAIIYASSISAFIGLGLLFWGIIFAYIRTGEYVKKALLDATVSSQIATLNEIIRELDCKGNAIYLPPKYLSEPEANKAYVPKLKGTKLPTPEETQEQDSQLVLSFIENPEAVLLTPPGAEYTKLFEKTLDTNFTRVDLQYLQQNMPKLFVEDLEIAQDFEMETEDDKIRVKIKNSVLKAPNTETEQPSSINPTLASPLSSAIACALAKATGKPITIEKQQTSEDGRDVTIEYRILEEEKQTEP